MNLIFLEIEPCFSTLMDILYSMNTNEGILRSEFAVFSHCESYSKKIFFFKKIINLKFDS